MPLSIEGQIFTAQRQREEDQRFLAKFGLEKLTEKLEREGVYAYGFSDEVSHRKATDLLFELSEDYLQSADVNLREKYFGKRGHYEVFEFSFWSSQQDFDIDDEDDSIAEPDYDFPDVIVFDKPFPNQDYEQRLRSIGVGFRTVPVYRLGELTEEEIRTMSGGIVWKSYCWVDLNETLRR